MTQSSSPWDGEVLGDSGAYDDDEWADIWDDIFAQAQANHGVLEGVGGELATTGAVTPLSTASGAAVVNGRWYQNTAAVLQAVSTPSVSTRIDRLVLRVSWAAQTVRITLVAGVEGAGVPPALVQIDGTTWDIPLYQVSITTGGVITLTDERDFIMRPHISPGGRLTLTSATPVTTADVSAATTLYYTPYVHNMFEAYANSAWRIKRFAELSLDISGLTADTPYDIFIYWNTTYPALESLAWTNTTTRATALALQNGRLVKSGDTTRLYLGTIHINSTGGQTEDTLTQRFVYNYYNRIYRPLKAIYSGTHAYITATWRVWNNDTANRIEWVQGVSESALDLGFEGSGSENTVTQNYMGFGIDTVTPVAGDDHTFKGDGSTVIFFRATFNYRDFPGIGYHYGNMVQKGGGAGIGNWQGARNTGGIWA